MTDISFVDMFTQSIDSSISTRRFLKCMISSSKIDQSAVLTTILIVTSLISSIRSYQIGSDRSAVLIIENHDRAIIELQAVIFFTRTLIDDNLRHSKFLLKLFEFVLSVVLIPICTISRLNEIQSKQIE